MAGLATDSGIKGKNFHLYKSIASLLIFRVLLCQILWLPKW
jgi:hypothetical protein